MNEELLKLSPERIWHYFVEILQIPRPSKKEEKIIRYLLNFGQTHQLETLQDETGNILIRKPASKGMENRKMVILQSHVDMVCEKNADREFDFNTDPIEAWVDDGWVKARGTTLGADDGIGIAAQLAILESDTLRHGPVECLFTVDEETGLTGAFGLKPGFLKGTILLNLDSEDDGQLFIGCAGGKDIVANLSVRTETLKDASLGYEISISGLLGGHSGDDISKGRGNAVKLMNRLLWEASNRYKLRLNTFNGGNLRNAIAREAFAVVVIPEEKKQEFEDYLNRYRSEVKAEYRVTEPDLEVSFEEVAKPFEIIQKKDQDKLLNALYGCPHGVIAWSAEIPGFVETSTNLAAVKFQDSILHITTSQRSSVESARDDVCNMVASVFHLAGAEVVHTDGYPGWAPNPKSEIVDITRRAYEELFQEKPEVLAVHAGLECGLIGAVYPDMDMISYGPTIKGAHSPDERLHIQTVEKFWDLTLKVLEKIPEKDN